MLERLVGLKVLEAQLMVQESILGLLVAGGLLEPPHLVMVLRLGRKALEEA